MWVWHPDEGWEFTGVNEVFDSNHFTLLEILGGDFITSWTAKLEAINTSSACSKGSAVC